MSEQLDLTRYSWYRPADPSWADREIVGRVRESLKKLDGRLDIWWCPLWKADDPEKPGRWGIYYWMQRAQSWSPVFWWEGAAGEFKPLSMECIEVILRKLHECDTTREGMDVYSIEKAAQLMRDSRLKKASADLREVMQEHARSYGRRLSGQLITVGPGGPRKRAGLGIDEDFEKYLRERGLR